RVDRPRPTTRERGSRLEGPVGGGCVVDQLPRRRADRVLRVGPAQVRNVGRGARHPSRPLTVEYRSLGRTGLEVSALGFGCGDVGGLIGRGSPAERLRAVERAIELGITYFDTAASYGGGLSEQHLGDALRTLRADAVVATKFHLAEEHASDVAGAVARSLEE